MPHGRIFQLKGFYQATTMVLSPVFSKFKHRQIQVLERKIGIFNKNLTRPLEKKVKIHIISA